MEEARAQLEEAIASSSASEYVKGNILYLAEHYADVRAKTAIKAIAEYETGLYDPLERDS